MKTKRTTAEIFSEAKVGLGATFNCGSDAYPFYISTLDEKNKIIGLYRPKSWFKKSWVEGDQEVEPFKPNVKPEKYLQAFRGHWYELNSKMQRLGKFNISLGQCYAYQDPSF